MEHVGITVRNWITELEDEEEYQPHKIDMKSLILISKKVGGWF